MQNPGSTPDRHDLFAAELANHYLIEEELGRDGSATVYLAQDLRHGRRMTDPDTPSGPRLTETGVTVGTPTYMSPEQAAGDEELSGRSDQYALAALVYEALAGAPPFAGPNARAIPAKKLTTAPAPLRQVRSDVPDAVDDAIMRALSRHPHERFESMEAFARAMSQAPGAITPASMARIAGAGAPPRRRLRRFAAVPLLLALGGGAWLMIPEVIGRPPQSPRSRRSVCSRCSPSGIWATPRTGISPTD